MINLIKQKLESINKLKIYTREILSLSPKSDDEKISNMIEVRQKYINSIDLIDLEIEKVLKSSENDELDNEEIKKTNKQIKESVKEIINMDKEIRKAISAELKDVKVKLNQPETKFSSLNIKA